MKTILYLIYFVVHLPKSFSQSNEGCVRDLLNNVDFPGNDIESVYAPDVNYCQKVCTEDSRCQFFTFLTRDWNTDTRRFYCYLKRTTTGQPTVKSNLQNVVSGYSLKHCGTQSPCFETVYDGLDFPGNDIRQSVVENEESCQRKCTAEADCQFFTFVKGEFHNDRQRFLCYRKKSERGTPPKITILQNVVSGFPLRGCEGCVRDLLNNVDFPGNDIESVYAPDVNYCQKVCTEDSRCQFFTFLTRDWNTDTRRFYCYLKRTTTGQPTVKSDLQNVVSGYSLKHCGTQYSCFETVYDGLDFPGNDIRQSVVENEESCQRKCTAEADCQFFTFVKGEFHNDRQRFLCYRKKSERGTPPKITILQNVVSGFPLRGCEGCVRDLLNNVDFPGNDIESVYAPDVNYCQKVCTEDSRCQFFTFLTRDWNTDTRRFYCYLKRTTTGQPTVKSDLQNVVSGYSLKHCGTQYSCFETVYDGLDFPGNDIRQSVVENEESCQRKCTAEADCQFFTFVKGEFHNDRQRFLCYRKKSERGTPPKITILQNVVSGFPLRGCEGCVRELLNNVDFPGNDIESVYAPDVNYCQKVCTEDSRCQFFTFLTRDWNTDTRRFYCYLKRTTTGQPTVKSDLQNVVSGYSLKHCGTQYSCFETVYDGLDFPGNDIRQSVVGNEESCQRKCTAEADCQFFTFVKGEFHNDRQRFLCYRKKSERGTPPKITILQNVVSGFPLRGCEGCVRDLLNNVDFPGNDIESVYAPDVNYCQKVCTEDSRCQFFTFLTRDWNTDTRRFYCYLKRTTTGQPTVKSDLQNVVSGYSLKHCGTQYSCFETVYDGLDFPGNDIRQSVVENEESCQRKCTAEADCQFFTFVKGEFHNDRQRFLCYRKKSERGTPPKITILQNVVSGFPLRGCEGCVRDLLNNVDFPGNDIESVYAPDVNYCQKVCTEDSRCQFFTFLTRDWNTDTRRFYCYLKRTTTGQPTVKSDLQNVVSGYSLKHCGTQYSCFETVYDGLDFPGNDIRQSVVENEESCQRKCTAEADCQFFTFVKGEFHNDRQRFLCYRKKSERGTPPKITILQNVVSGFPLRGCEGCVRDLLNNVDFPGNDIESVYAPDVNYCQKVCTEDSRCQFFTFLTRDWNTDTRRFYCYLKRTTTGQPTVKSDLQNVVSGYSLKHCGTQFSCFETVYDGLDFPGNDIRQSVVENEESCQRKCTAEADCQFFTFVKGEFHNDRQRFLCYRKKSERGTPPKITILQNVVSGFPLRGCEGCVRDLLNNVDFPGNDIESVYAPDVNYCQKVCTEDSRCQFFTFLTRDWNTDTRRFYCYLKRTTTGQPTVKSDLQNVVSGYSLKHCGTQFSCFETVYDGLDFPGNDIRQSVVENEESCQRKCTAEADCQFFTFVKGEFHNDQQRFLCYRKKSERGTPPKITILQNVVSGFPLRGCEGCVRDLLNNVDFPGNDIESVYAPDVNYCQKVCTEDSRCQFFTFLTRDWNTDTRRFYCYLKRTTTGQPTVKSDLQNVVSGYSLKHCGTQFSCFETVYDGLDFPGNDIRQSVVKNEESCQRKCTAEADCQFFTFVKGEFHNDRQRFLCYRKKSERGTPPKITILQNVVSGFPLRGCEGCVRDLLNNVDFPGNDIESVYAPDVNYCQKVCTEDSRCQFFTFLTRDWNTDTRRFYCYLKRTTTGQPTVKSDLQNVVSGYSLKHCGTQFSCFETVYDGLDFPENDIRQSVVENEESCQRKCTAEADCQFFTFVKGEFHNDRQRFLCYRKKSERGTPPKITILQNVVSGFPLRGCEGCARGLLIDVDFPGNDIESVYAPDVNYCQKVCTEESSCQFFTFLTRDWNTDTRKFYCYLKRTTTGQPTVKSNLQNVVSGYSLKHCGTQSPCFETVYDGLDFPGNDIHRSFIENEESCQRKCSEESDSCFETVYDGLDFPGNDIRQSVVENEESCQRKCTAEADCQFFTFVKGEFHNDRQRFLCYRKKSERGTPPKITILQNVVSGFPLRGCEGCVRNLLSNVDFPGNDIESVYAPDVNYCQKVCTESSQCQFFTFLTRDWNTNDRRFYCYLKRTTTGQPTVKSDLQNVVSGYSLEHCGTQSSCFETVYDGLDFPGNDIRQSVIEDEESCQRKCTEESDCQFFTFVKGEFHNDRQRYLCYRKKSERGTPPRITILQNVVSGFSLRKCGVNNSD